MELTWLGHSCFRIRGQQATVITDPFDPALPRFAPINRGQTGGYPYPADLSAQVVTISHDHPGHSYAQGVAGSPRVLRKAGEYQVAGMLILGFASYHDDASGQRLGKNTVFCLEVDGLWLCHLGDLGHLPSPELVAGLTPVDILLVPAGGGSTLSPSQAVEAITRLEPRVVVPMHYRPEAGPDLSGENRGGTEATPPVGVERFLKEMGVGETSRQPRLSLTRSGLPRDTQVVVLTSPPSA